VVGGIGAVVGLAPHVLHHIGLHAAPPDLALTTLAR
jgi:hypothetical protein